MATVTATGTSNTLTSLESANPGFFTKPNSATFVVDSGDILRFDPNADTTITATSQHLVIEGELEMKPASASIEHILLINGVVEASVEGAKARPVSAVSGTGTSRTFTVQLEPGQTQHNITTNDKVIAQNFVPTTWNNNSGYDHTTGYTVTGVTANTVTCTIPANPASATTLGQIKANDKAVAFNDFGLWFQHMGISDIQGTAKQTWTRIATAPTAGTATLVCEDTLTGWQAGDTVVICPSDESYDNFTEKTVLSVNSATVTFTTNWSAAEVARHPILTMPSGTVMGTEVLNLTNNVRIEGQSATQRTHVMWHIHEMAMPSNFQYVTLRYMGPRQAAGGGGTRKITGRWPMHLHKAEDSLVGSTFNNIVIRDSGSHAFVQHATNDITLTDCVGYNNAEFQYWWDFDHFNDFPHDIVWDRCVGARTRFLDGSADVHRMGTFQLHFIDEGLTGTVRDCVAVGLDSNGRDAAGFLWPEAQGGGAPQDSPQRKEWVFEGTNVSHNNRVNGFFVWMNDSGRHDVDNIISYRNGKNGISFGAYLQPFRWRNIDLYGNGWNAEGHGVENNTVGRLDVRGFPQMWTGRIDGAGDQKGWYIGHAAVPFADDVRVTDVAFTNCADPLIEVDEVRTSTNPHRIDFVRCTRDDADLVPADFDFITVHGGLRIRVQRRNNTAWQFTTPATPNPSTPGAVVITDPIAPFALYVSTAALPNGNAGTSYSATLASALGIGTTRTWSLKSGSLPTGLSLASNGNITGTPTAVGTSEFVVQVIDNQEVTADKELSITVTGVLTITTSSVPGANQNVAYQTTTLAATGGTGSLTWSVVSGTLPTGITLGASTGILSGTPTGSGTSNFTVRVVDSTAAFDDQALTIIVAPAPSTLNIDTTTLPGGTVDTAYAQTVAASGGTPAYSFSVLSGSLPTGLSLTASGASAGLISGTPTTAGTFNFTIRVTDQAPATDDQAFSVVIAPASVSLTITNTSLPTGTVSVAYDDGTGMTATGGTGKRTWSVSSGTLPTGLSMASGTGVISGTPTTAGISLFTVRVTDTGGGDDTQDISIQINAALTIITTTLPDALDDTPYTQFLQAQFGTAPYSWSITAGALPTGITLTAGTGELSGTPTSAGLATFTATVTDAVLATDTQALTILVAPAVAVSTTVLPGGTEGVAYQALLHATGGTTPYSWFVVASGGGGSGGGVGGELPTGLTLSNVPENSDGRIAGTPTVPGVFVFTVRVADAQDREDDQELTISISAAPVTPPTSFDGLRRRTTLSQGGTGNADASLDVGV